MECHFWGYLSQVVGFSDKKLTRHKNLNVVIIDQSLENCIYPVNDDCPLIHENEIFLEISSTCAFVNWSEKQINILLYEKGWSDT